MDSNPTIDEAGLKRLSDFLDSDRTPAECMSLGELDGFLTALASGPTELRPSDWLPEVWGGEAPAFESMDEAREILGLMMALYESGITRLESEEPFAPCLDGGEEFPALSRWCNGYLHGMNLESESWDALLEGEEALRITPVLAIAMAGRAEQPDDDNVLRRLRSEAEARQKMMAAVPASVRSVYAFWSEILAAEQVESPVRGGVKVGRNEPCPCGSGKKFKKCCGAPGREVH